MRDQTFVKFLLLILFSLGCGLSLASEPTISVVDSLERDSLDAKQHGLILMVLVTLPECVVCEYVKTHHLEPMVRSGSLSKVAIVRELDLSGISFIDFNGKLVEPEDFAHRYDASFSPSLLFFSPDGSELHEPLIGMGSRDYYGFYLDKAIAKSVKRLGG